MVHSVEARLPFTDYRLVELAMRMPRPLKFAHGLNKTGLRRAATGRVPSSVTAKPTKLGFPVSISTRALADLRTVSADLISSRAFVERGVYHVGNAQALLTATRQSATVDQTDALFQLAQTEIWLRGLGPQALRVIP